MAISRWTAGAALALVAAAAAAQPPVGMRPMHVAGAGIYVRDLEAQKAWYMGKLGLALVRSYDRDGKPFEYLLGLDDGAGRAVVVLAASTNRPAGPNAFSRLILEVPDAKALAAQLATEGVPSREAVPDVAYFVRDPEGNPIELYTPPKS